MNKAVAILAGAAAGVAGVTLAQRMHLGLRISSKLADTLDGLDIETDGDIQSIGWEREIRERAGEVLAKLYGDLKTCEGYELRLRYGGPGERNGQPMFYGQRDGGDILKVNGLTVLMYDDAMGGLPRFVVLHPDNGRPVLST